MVTIPKNLIADLEHLFQQKLNNEDEKKMRSMSMYIKSDVRTNQNWQKSDKLTMKTTGYWVQTLTFFTLK